MNLIQPCKMLSRRAHKNGTDQKNIGSFLHLSVQCERFSSLFLLVISEHGSVDPQLIKWADYVTPSSVDWCSCHILLLMNSSQLSLIFLVQVHLAT